MAEEKTNARSAASALWSTIGLILVVMVIFATLAGLIFAGAAKKARNSGTQKVSDAQLLTTFAKLPKVPGLVLVRAPSVELSVPDCSGNGFSCTRTKVLTANYTWNDSCSVLLDAWTSAMKNAGWSADVIPASPSNYTGTSVASSRDGRSFEFDLQFGTATSSSGQAVCATPSLTGS